MLALTERPGNPPGLALGRWSVTYGQYMTDAPVPDRTAPLGRLDTDTARPARTLLAAKLAAVLLVAAFAVVAALLLAPQIGSALGFARLVPATVTAITPLPAEQNAEGSRCTREQVTVRWGDGQTGYFITCAATDASAMATPPAAGDMRVAVGDIVQVRAVAGWDSVVLGPRWPNAILVAVLAAVLAAAVIAGVRYRREYRLLAAATRTSPPGTSSEPLAVQQVKLAMSFDAISFGKGKRVTVQLAFADAGYRPLRAQISGATAEAMQWRRAALYPLGRTRRGLPAGPYVIRPVSGGTLVALGRALRTTPIDGSP